jgi:hypothetical protein
MNILESPDLLTETLYTPAEIAKITKLHVSKVRRIFLREPGVIRIGSSGTRRKRSYWTIRIPQRVAVRVLGRMTRGFELAEKSREIEA